MYLICACTVARSYFCCIKLAILGEIGKIVSYAPFLFECLLISLKALVVLNFMNLLGGVRSVLLLHVCFYTFSTDCYLFQSTTYVQSL